MSECGRCLDCRWWEHITWMNGKGTCARISNMVLADEALDREKAVVADSAPGHSLYTSADFGCVQFEAREAGEGRS